MTKGVFYCVACGVDRPKEGSKRVEVKRGKTFAKVLRCVVCLDRAKGSAEERDARAAAEVKEKRQAATYAVISTREKSSV